MAFAVDGKKLHWNSKCRNCVRCKKPFVFHNWSALHSQCVPFNCNNGGGSLFGRKLSYLNSIFRISIWLEYFTIGVSKLVFGKIVGESCDLVFVQGLICKCQTSRKHVLAKQKEENSTLLSILTVG